MYIINVEAAQNQLNLKEQLQTSKLLNKNFGKSFKRNLSTKDFQSNEFKDQFTFYH